MNESELLEESLKVIGEILHTCNNEIGCECTKEQVVEYINKTLDAERDACLRNKLPHAPYKMAFIRDLLLNPGKYDEVNRRKGAEKKVHGEAREEPGVARVKPKPVSRKQAKVS